MHNKNEKLHLAAERSENSNGSQALIYKLDLRAKAVLGLFAFSYMAMAFFLTRMMAHSTWLVWASLVSFLVTSWTTWIEFPPRNLKELRATRPLTGVRFLAGLSAAFYLTLFSRVTWYLTGSAPYLIESEMAFHLLFVGLFLHFPFSIWASGVVVKRR